MGNGSAKEHPLYSEQEAIFHQPGSKSATLKDFDLLTVIGKGSFGKVMQVRHKDTGQIYAMKVLRKEAVLSRNQIAHTKTERNILEKINHPFTVNLRFAFQNDDKLYMVMDYVNGGELFFHLKKEGRFPEERVRMYAAEIASALGHLHSLGVIYRDLKPENILVDSEGHIRVTDFGLSKEVVKDEVTHTFCGTPEYLAPEVLNGDGHGFPVDWWSLGTLVYEMLTGLPPFYSQNVNVMYHKILNGELRFPPYISSEAKSLIQDMLQRDPKRRLGTKGASEVFSHPFFKKIDWNKLNSRGYTPAFKPPVKNAMDTSQFDSCFTKEEAMDTLVQSPLKGSDKEKMNFDNFDFVAKDTTPHAGKEKSKKSGKSKSRGGSHRGKSSKKSSSKAK